ncbi:MAG: chemotaxis protein CheX [Pirellulales bacterium]
MNDQQLSQLSTVTVDVLKAAAFSWGEPCPTVELGTEFDDVLLTQVRFSGPSTGVVGLAMPEQLATTLAADILSADGDDLTAEQIEDACKELANVVCGQWLTAAFGSQPVFKLSVPEAARLNRDGWCEWIDAPTAIGVQIDDQPLAAQICLD